MTETPRQRETRFAMAVPALINKAQELGYFVTLGEVWRTPEQAEWNAEHGKGIAHSLHEQRLAIDLLLYAPDGTYITDGTGYTELGEWWCAQSPDFCWGGNFHTKDFDHFSLTPDGGKTQ